MPNEETVHTGPFSPEQMDNARKVYEGLTGIFGPKPASPDAASTTQTETGDHKHFADVTDKALNMFSHGVAQIAATTEQAAPVVWRIMVKQQIANAIANLIGPIFALF